MSKRKKTKSPNLDKIEIPKALQENTYLEWVTKYGHYLGYTFLAIIALIVIGTRMKGNNQQESQRDFISADSDFMVYQREVRTNKDPEASRNALNQIIQILKKHPELHAKYDGKLAQLLLIQGDVTEAQQFANNSFDRIQKDNLPLYLDFAKTTFTIANNDLEQALQQSNDLKEKMIEQGKDNFSDILYGCNLLRIASLQQQLQLTSDEKATWMEWMELYNEDDSSTTNIVEAQALKQIMKEISEGNVTLNDYITERQKQLGN